MIAFFLAACLTAGDDPIKKPFAGFQFATISKEQASLVTPEIPTRSSTFLVVHVLAGGPADKAGLKRGDAITEIDNQKITDEATYRQCIGLAKENKKTRFLVYRLDRSFKPQRTKANPNPTPHPEWVKRTCFVQLEFVEESQLEVYRKELTAGATPFSLNEISVKPIVVAASPTVPPLPPDERHLQCDGGNLIARVEAYKIYLPSSGDVIQHRFLEHSFQETGKSKQSDTAGFYTVKGKATELKIESGDAQLLALRKDPKFGLEFTFRSAGKVPLIFKLDDQKIGEIELDIIRLEINLNDPDSEVIKKFGLPDQKLQRYCKWPENELYDNIFYSVEPSVGIISAMHWKWKKYPELTVSIVDSKVYRIGSCWRQRDWSAAK